MYLLDKASTANLRKFVAAGGTLTAPWPEPRLRLAAELREHRALRPL